MTNRSSKRGPYRRRGGPLVVFSELNLDLQPAQLTRIIVAAGLEQARREKEAREAIGLGQREAGDA